ncbi:MAG: hypothetical protein M1830_003805 [Pleopsidium flavum]|nr:MAG: hypothetical protein M1830_003805 [Pleopsidium flavum]
MGRKLNIFDDQLCCRERELKAEFAGFCNRIRPSPMAAKANQRMVWERGNSLMDVQMKVADFRDDVIIPFQKNIIEVEKFIGQPDIFTSPNFSFDLRFDLLFFRCRLATLQEAMRISDFLKPLNDPSQQIQALAQGLRTITSEQSVRNVIATEEAISKCEERNMKCLEVELRLIQLSFHIIARFSGVEPELDTEVSCAKVVRLCRRYPDTAGRFLKSYRNLKRSLDGLQSLVQIYTVETMDVWRRWAKHAVGHLTRCGYGHPYSTATFNGCPECGREVEVVAAPEPVDYESYMKNDEFLAKMKEKA